LGWAGVIYSVILSEAKNPVGCSLLSSATKIPLDSSLRSE
jgi:hypothetical protein